MTDVAANVPDTAAPAAPVTPTAPAAAPVTPDIPVAVTPPTLPTTQPDWRLGLPEDIRGNPTLAKFSSVEALAKSHVNAVQMIGRDKIPIPKDGESWDDFYKAAGRPEDAKGYVFAAPEGLPEDFDYVPEVEDGFKEIAHKAGLSVTQAQSLRDWYVSMAAGQHVAGEDVTSAKMGESLQTLQREWGNALPQKLNMAKAAAEKLGGSEFVEALEETGLGNDIRLIRGLAKIAEATGGDKGLIGEAMQEHTPAELQIQIADFEAKHIKALTDKTNPENAIRAQQRMALYEKMFPGKAA